MTLKYFVVKTFSSDTLRDKNILPRTIFTQKCPTVNFSQTTVCSTHVHIIPKQIFHFKMFQLVYSDNILTIYSTHDTPVTSLLCHYYVIYNEIAIAHTTSSLSLVSLLSGSISSICKNLQSLLNDTLACTMLEIKFGNISNTN